MTKERSRAYDRKRSIGGDQTRYRKRREEAAKRYVKLLKEDPGFNRKLLLKKRYNIKIEDYNKMLAEQSGVCAICNRQETQIRLGKVQSLGVDHDHKTGKIRGILCAKCNTLLGKAEDDINILNSAIDYLTKHKESI